MRKLKQILSRGGLVLAPYFLGRSFVRLLARKVRVLVFRKVHRVECGTAIFLGPRIQLNFPQKIQLHDRVSIAADVCLASEHEEGYLVLKEGAQINRRAEIDFSGGLTIERNVLVSAEAIIYTHDHGLNPRALPTFTPLHIGEGAWIGVKAIVLPSVNYIGKYAVIGAGAVVTKDVPDRHVFVGAAGRVFPITECIDG